MKKIIILLTDFIPHQMSFGVKGGCEAAVHAVRTFLNDEEAEIIVKIDLSNAFNSAVRDTMLYKVTTSIPAFHPFFHQCYAKETYLCSGNDIITSRTGCQKGDPANRFWVCSVLNDSINLNSKLSV